MDGKMAQILLIDDDNADIELTKEALLNSKLKINLTVANDGVEGLEYLRNGGNPDIILLDLNMPKKPLVRAMTSPFCTLSPWDFTMHSGTSGGPTPILLAMLTGSMSPGSAARATTVSAVT